MTKATQYSIQPMTPYQKFVLVVLAFLQFTVILDFMIISPLGVILIPTLNITASQFGLVVSVYAFSAGISGLLAAGFADKFDRKRILLFFYFGFILSTLFCGLAPTFRFLVVARTLTGLFGGVIGSIVFAITTDLFPLEMRGRVMGVLQTAFAGSQILGLPIGLFLSNHMGWHAPFLWIVAMGVGAGIFITLYLKPINSHLNHSTEQNALHHLVKTVSTPRYLFAFSSTALLSLGGFMMMPFGSTYTVNNLGVNIENLPVIYMVTGLSSMFFGPLVGRVSDAVGKFKTFLFGTAVSIVMVLIYTHLGVTPLPWVILVNTVMFIGIFSRMIPSQALVSAIPDPSSRGSFMSISSSMQQISGGFASILAGMIVVQKGSGSLDHFDRLGFILVGTSLVSAFMIYFINQMVTKKSAT